MRSPSQRTVTLEASLVDLREIVQRIADECPGLRMAVGDPADVVGDAERLMELIRT